MRHSRGLVAAVAAALIPMTAPGLLPAAAIADLEQEGDNSSEVDIDQSGEGGDAIAGSQVISVSGSGPTNIRANNNSRFARAEGGDVDQNAEVHVESGPRLRVSEPETNVSAEAEGSATTTQEATPPPATPSVDIGLEQVSTPTGDAQLSSTALAVNVAAGTGGPGELLQSGDVLTTATTLGTTAQSSEASDVPVNDVAAADVNGVNNAEVTGTAPVSEITTAFASPTDHPTAQSTNNDVVAPRVDVTGRNNAVVVGSAPVSQVSTAVASPMARASSSPSRTSGRLYQNGDNDAEADIASANVGGDGIAGSNVIGVAGGGGATTIRAANSSDFAVSEGGNTEADSFVDIANGPSLEVSGSTSNVAANATGVADAMQTATPNVSIDVSQFTDPEGEIATSNGVTTVTALETSSVAVGTGGPLSRSVSQSVFPSSSNALNPQLSVIGSNSASVMSSAGVNQAAHVQADPQAVSELGGVP